MDENIPLHSNLNIKTPLVPQLNMMMKVKAKKDAVLQKPKHWPMKKSKGNLFYMISVLKSEQNKICSMKKVAEMNNSGCISNCFETKNLSRHTCVPI